MIYILIQKSTKQPKASNGTNLSESDSPDISSPGSEISDNSDDGNHSDPEKVFLILTSHNCMWHLLSDLLLPEYQNNAEVE